MAEISFSASSKAATRKVHEAGSAQVDDHPPRPLLVTCPTVRQLAIPILRLGFNSISMVDYIRGRVIEMRLTESRSRHKRLAIDYSLLRHREMLYYINVYAVPAQLLKGKPLPLRTDLQALMHAEIKSRH